MTVKTELQVLKERADIMGITYKGNISTDKLRTMVNSVQSGTESLETIKKEAVEQKDAPVKKEATPQEIAVQVARQKSDHRVQMVKDCNKLIRVRVTCMNPDRAEHPGEIFTVSNSVVGTIKKYVPFNADEGWHVPQMILNMMEERMCQVFVSKRVNGTVIKKGKLVKEFAIERLDALTPEELKIIEIRQAASATLQD